MKTPINVSEIRKGDLIRCEKDGNEFPVAVEYVASGDEQTYWASGYVCDFYLLDRPTPPVSLPTEPTLGWLTTSDCSAAYDGVPIDVPVLDTWRAARYPGISLDRNGKSCGVSNGMVTAFVPAVAVPRAAYDELQEHVGRIAGPFSVLTTSDLDAVHRFLAAIDEANGDRP